MSLYTVQLSRSAAKSLDKMDDRIAVSIIEALDGLSTNPRPRGFKKLTGRKKAYRIRVGDYRVIYHIFDQLLIVDVIAIGSRQDIYQKS